MSSRLKVKDSSFLGGLIFAAAFNVKIIPFLAFPLLFCSRKAARERAKFVFGIILGGIPFLVGFFVVGDSFFSNIFDGNFNSKNQASGLYNIGSGRARSWNDLARAIFTAMGLPSRIEYIEMPAPLRDRYQYFTEACLDKLRLSGFDRPATSLEEAVADYISYLNRGARLSALPE